MKTKTKGIIASLLAIPAALLGSGNVFADNSYNINYSGGSDLGASGTIKIDKDLVENIENSSLLNPGESTTKLTIKGDGWQSGYYKLDDDCREAVYYKATKSGTVSNLSFAIENNKYAADIVIKKIELDGISLSQGQFVPIVIDKETKSIFVKSGAIYPNSYCANEVAGVVGPAHDGKKAFVEMNIKLREASKTTTYLSDKLYFGITDIDSAQSFKILNQGNGFSESTTLAKSKEDLQRNKQDGNYKNKFVTASNGNYIYSEYSNTSPFILDNGNTANIYVKLSNQTQTDGLNVVFGYASDAASAIEYFTQQYTVTYKSDSHGTVSGKTSEEVKYMENPTGSQTTPEADYRLICWKADKEVMLKNGKTVAKNTCVNPTQVVVKSDLVFTAYHTNKYVVTYVSDAYGEITGIKNEEVDVKGHPAGSTQKPAEDYEFKYWIADKDVTLDDGKTTIKAGDPITSEQILKVVVNEDLELKAIHTSKGPAAPNTGASTGEFNAAPIAVSVFGITLGALFIAMLPRLTHKKIKFD